MTSETLLALDLGTQCGWCIHSGDAYTSGAFLNRGGRYDGGGMRYVIFRRQLKALHEGWSFDRVVFEEVRRHMGTDAAHVYGGMMAILTAFCEEHSIPYAGIPVGTIKKLATGKGNADKQAMIAAARARWPELTEKLTSDEADARWICEAGLKMV